MTDAERRQFWTAPRYGYFEFAGTSIYNVSIGNEDYRVVQAPTVIDIGD
jgi:hypothetical protein